MKRTLAAAAVAVLAGTVAANAADLYSGGLKDAPVPLPPTWTGFYMGAHVGGAWSDLETTDIYGAWGARGTGDTAGYKWNDSASGVLGGGQVGYNWQASNVFNGFVLGFEADFGGTAFSFNHHPLGDPTLTNSLDNGFYADVTGRLGYAAGPALFYVKGGWAYFDGSRKLSDTSYGRSVAGEGLNGWTFGGGVEYKFAQNWSAKLEYRYFEFDNVTDALYPSDGGFKRDLTANAMTVGVNYFWTPAYTPLK